MGELVDFVKGFAKPQGSPVDLAGEGAPTATTTDDSLKSFVTQFASRQYTPPEAPVAPVAPQPAPEGPPPAATAEVETKPLPAPTEGPAPAAGVETLPTAPKILPEGAKPLPFAPAPLPKEPEAVPPGGGGGGGYVEEPRGAAARFFAPQAPTPPGTVERLGRQVIAGALGTAEGMGGALQWITGGTLGKDFSDYMAGLRKEVTPEGEASFVEQLASGAGSMATFFIPGFGVGRGLGLAAKVAPKAAAWLGAGTMAVTEAGTEAGQVYRDQLDKGLSPDKASNSASWTFFLNLPVLTLTDKLAFFGNEGRVLARALKGMVSEGSQESLQEVISTWSKDEQQNLKNILTSGEVGALLGGGMGAIAKPSGQIGKPATEPIAAPEPTIAPEIIEPQVAIPEEVAPIAKTPQPEAPTPEAQREAIFGGVLGETIEGQPNRADAIRALVPQIGDQARAERFYDLYQQGDAETALKEFPEMSAWATEQQKAAQKAPKIPAPMASAGAATEAAAAAPAPETTEIKERPGAPPVEPSAPAAPMGTTGRMMEVEAKPTEAEPVPVEEAPKETVLPPGVKEFQAKYGTARGVGKPEGLVSKHGTLDRALETGNLAAIVRHYGGFRSDSELIRNFEPEEQKGIYLLSRKPREGISAQGPDELAAELRANHPEQFGHIENGEQLLRMIANKDIYKKANLDKMVADVEEGYAALEKDAATEGYFPEDVARATAEDQGLQRAERDAIVREGSAGPHDLEAGWPGAEEAPALRAGAPKPTALTTRLDALEADYPGVDREKAATVIRALPNAEDGQIVNMAADLEMFAQVARGNLAASEKAQLLKKATDAGAQLGLPGMGGPVGLFDVPPPANGKRYSIQEARQYSPVFYSQMQTHLEAKLPGKGSGPDLANLIEGWGQKGQFKADELKWSGLVPWLREQKGTVTKQQVADFLKEGQVLYRAEGEPAPTFRPEEAVTLETVKREMGKAGYLVKEAEVGDATGYHITLPNGKMIFVITGKEFTKPSLEEIKLTYPNMTQERLDRGVVAGEWRPISLGGIASLAKEAGVRTFRHEVGLHGAADLVLTTREMKALLQEHGDWEAAARAYEDWSPHKGPENAIFRKIWEFFRNIMHLIRPTGESTFEQIARGEVWLRKEVGPGAWSVEGKGPLPFAPERYRIVTDPAETDRYGFVRPLMKPMNYLSDIITGTQKLIAPGAISKEYLQSAHVLRNHLGTLNRHGAETITNVKAEGRKIDKMGVNNPNIPLEENPGMKLASDISMGRPVSPEFENIARKMQTENAQRVAWMEQVDAPLETVRENYFGMIWTRDSRRAFHQAVTEAVEAGRGMEAVEGGVGGQTMNLNGWSVPDKAWVKARVNELMAKGQGTEGDIAAFLARRPFKGKEGFRQQKVFDDVMTGIEFGLIPFSNNPVDIFLAKTAEMDRSIYANGAIKEFKDRGDIQFNHVSKSIPEGWAKIEDRYGTVYGPYDPETGARPIYGHWIAKTPVAEIINNSLSLSLYNNPYIGKAFKAFMATGNLLNQFQLMSGFHIGFTAGETQISAGAQAIQDFYGVLRGTTPWSELGKTLKAYPTAIGKFATEGNKVLSEYRTPTVNVPTDVPVGSLPDTKEHHIAMVAKAAEIAGGGFTMEAKFRTQQAGKMIKEWYGGQKIKAALRSPVALTEMAMKPIMDFLVPRQKAAVFSELVGRITRQNPSKTLTELRPELNEAWNWIDGVLGQVRYDRIFMREGAKNAMQALLRAPGWTGGTIERVGGAPVDVVRFIKEWTETGKLPAKLPDRVAYTLSLLGTIAIANGLLNWLFTGDRPKDMDWFAFRTGEIDSKGRQVRFLLPSYVKDLFAWHQAPVHTAVAKTHPLWSMIGELARNKDYYNTVIRDPESSQAQQLLDMGTYSLKQFIPFGIRGMQQIGEYAKFGEEPGRFIAPQFGIMPAPRAYTSTPAQQVIEEYNLMTRSAYSTKETAEKKKLKSDLTKLARDQDEAGFKAMADQAVSEGKITRQQEKQIVEESQAPPGMGRFIHLPLEYALRTWNVASDYEKEQWKPYFLKKVMGEKPENIIRLREPLADALDAMGPEMADAAEKVRNLTMPEETGVDLTGLGLLKPAPEMAGMEEVGAAIAAGLETKLEPKVKKSGLMLPRASTREKKRPYDVLGL